MVNILLIADQVRLEQIVLSAAKACNAQVRYISSLNIPDEAKTVPPAIIFIQNRLSGLSGDILARHLRSVFSAGSASIILLSDDPDDAQRPFKFVDRCIGLGETDVEIELKVTDAITCRMEPGGGAAGQIDRIETSIPATELDDRVSISGGQPTFQVRADVNSPFLHKLEGALSDLEPQPIQPSELAGEADHSTETDVADGNGLHAPERQRTRPWLFVGLAVVFAASLYFFVGGGKTNGKQPASPAGMSPGRPLASEGMTGLPSFIPKDKPDPAYGKGHPGWERYLGSGSEFRVFRQNSVVKALQIIDRSGKGLSAPFIGTVLRQVAGIDKYTIATTEPKDTFLIEKGSTDRAGIIVYRQKSDRQIRAFVLYFQ